MHKDPKQAYEKPKWEKNEIFEKFSLACTKKMSDDPGCTGTLKN
jgi:hypothetical protein